MNEAIPEAALAHAPPVASDARDAHCRKSIDAFVAQCMTAEEFHCSFCNSTGGAIADPRLVGAMRTIRELCDAYAGGLSPKAGYRVSAEQFRSEVCHVASAPTAALPTRSGDGKSAVPRRR